MLHAVPAVAPRAIAYIRVSKEREDMISPELQLTAIRDHCHRHGYQLGEVIEDLDLSGRFWKRRQMERAIGMLERHEAEVIVVWKQSRVARNRLDWNVAVDRIEAAGGRLESATEPIDTSTSSGRLARGMLAEIAAFESERAGEQWKETHRRRLRNGLPTGGRARFGYQPTRDGYVIDPDEAEIVREGIRRYLAGDGVAHVGDFFRAAGAGPTSGPGVSSWLRSGFFAGQIDYHDPDCPDPHKTSRQTRCPRRLKMAGAHDPIVDSETWEAVQAEAARRTSPASGRRPKSAFTTLTRCGTCGRGMGRQQKTSGRVVLACTHRGCEFPASVSERRVEDVVVDWLAGVAGEVMSSPERSAASDAAVARLERKAAQAESALAQLTVDYARRIIPEGAYLAARDTLTAERDDAAREAARMRAGDGRRQEEAVSLLEAWPELDAVGRNRVLRVLCRVTVTRSVKPHGRAEITVRGLWEH